MQEERLVIVRHDRSQSRSCVWIGIKLGTWLAGINATHTSNALLPVRCWGQDFPPDAYQRKLELPPL
jgi:hypothetical protein